MALKKKQSKPFPITSGVHQRSDLSPILFNIVMKAVPQIIESKLFKELLCADELLILVDTMQEAKDRLNIWTKALKKFDLKVNLDETKAMIFNFDDQIILLQATSKVNDHART